jgi:hypothetical protein
MQNRQAHSDGLLTLAIGGGGGPDKSFATGCPVLCLSRHGRGAPRAVGERHFVRACYPIRARSLPDSCAPCPFRARRARFVRAVPVSAFCRIAGFDGLGIRCSV